ncbi:MAG: c-type cytochrome [Acidiferrobacterales bacterium]
MKTASLFLITGLLLTACSDNPNPQGPPTATPTSQSTAKIQKAQPPAARERDFAKVMRGRKLFTQNCASCHGSQAEGTPQWSTPGTDGRYPPPPLNGTAHTWHHPTPVLKRTIREGTIAIGGKMPPWGGKLSDKDMEAIIAWFQSLWPDEIYDTWARMDAEVRNNQAKQ